MISQKLKQHISYSKAAADANKAKGNRHIDILSSLYSDASHFIEELLQNADDACLKKNKVKENGSCSFVLDNNILQFSHNGREFDEDDIISITTIGQSTKKENPDINLTGKFGLGFKSTFAICNEPEIYSGKFNFKIIDFEVPHFLEKNRATTSETSFFFPLKESKNTKSIVEKGVANINYRHLLFTKCLTSINVALPHTSFNLSKSIVKTFDKHLSIIQISNNLTTNTPLLFLLFDIPLPNNKSAQCAFLISDLNNSEYIHLKNEPAFVVFPTLFQTGLQFAINAPFTTTPTREQIPFDEEKTPENFQILQHIQKGFSGLLQLMKKHKLLNTSFFGLLPFDIDEHKNNPIAHAIVNGLIHETETKAVWPSVSMKFFSASKMLVCDSQIQQLLSDTEVKMLFNRDTVLNHDVAKMIPNHLHSKKPFSLFKFADDKDFAFAISSRSELLKKKNPKWHSSFLTFVSKHPDLWNKTKQNSWFSLRKKQFILLNDMNIACPFEDEEAVVFLYDKSKRNTPMVHRELMANSEIADFFQQLGLPDPDEMYEFRKTITTILSDIEINPTKLIAFWLQIIQLYSESNEGIRIQMIERLKKHKLLPATDSLSEQYAIARADEVYFNSPQVATFLQHTQHLKINLQFLEKLNKKGISNEFLEEFFTEMGVQLLPAFIPFDNQSRLKEFEVHRQRIENRGLIVVAESVTDYDLHGLDDFFKHPSHEKSLVLAFLASNFNKQAIYKAQTYTQDFTFSSASTFEHILSTKAWLYDTDGLLNPDSKTSSLHLQYFHDEMSIEKICKMAGIQLQSTDFSNNETELILKLRKLKLSPELQEQAIKEFVGMRHYYVHEESTAEPLVIDYMTDNESSPLPNAEIKNTSAPDEIIFPESAYNKFFIEHPLRNKAEQIALGVLVKKFGKQNIELHTSGHAGVYQISHRDNPKMPVIISGISQSPGLFVFPHYPELQDENQCIYVAVDNIGGGTPVVYLRIIDKKKKDKAPYFVLSM
jgi:hypothetical protein